MNRAIASSLVLLTSLTSCQYLRLPEPYPSDESSAQAPSYASNEMAPLQQTAKSTLLADNEQLRDQLALALEDRRKLTTALSQEQDELAQLRQQCKDREDAIAQLSEQLAQTKKHLADMTGERDKMANDRKALAEMYAMEKKQRLAFEKELLEREIAERTHQRDQP
jgi:septal ring factor EnvC (AmiA/AmiB activator)